MVVVVKRLIVVMEYLVIFNFRRLVNKIWFFCFDFYGINILVFFLDCRKNELILLFIKD